jgi:hypothetical protein
VADTPINELQSPGEHFPGTVTLDGLTYELPAAPADPLVAVVERLDWIACALSGGHVPDPRVNSPAFNVCRRCGYDTGRRTP